MHTRPRVHRAPGIPHALFGRKIHQRLGRIAPRGGKIMSANQLAQSGTGWWAARDRAFVQILEPRLPRRQQTMQANFMRGDVMHRWILLLAMLATALWSVPALAQSRAQLGPLCTSEGTPVDQQIDACNKIITLKVFSGEKLATIYFWRAV